MSKPTLLTWNLRDERSKKIRLIAMRLAITIRPVEKHEYALTIGELLEGAPEGFEHYQGEAFDDEMLVMAHFHGGQINKFLDAFRQMRVPSVRLKAVLTDTNRGWHSMKLHEDLSEESKVFTELRKQVQMKQAVAQAQARHEQESNPSEEKTTE